MWMWLILIPVGLVLLLLLLAFIGGLTTLIPLPISNKKLANEIVYIIDLCEGRHPEETYSDSADIAFNQRIWNNELERIRQACLEVGRLHPSTNQLFYCDSEGVSKLKELLRELRDMEQRDQLEVSNKSSTNA